MWFLIVFLLSLSPRLIIALMWIFSDYLGKAFDGIFWPILGFIFMPWTTLWSAYVYNNGGFTTWRRIVLIICIVADFGTNSEHAPRELPEMPTEV
jgi:hypothetical protein